MQEVAMLATLKQFRGDQSGATAIEYGLICAAIALAILVAVNTTGEELLAKLTFLLDMLS